MIIDLKMQACCSPSPLCSSFQQSKSKNELYMIQCYAQVFGYLSCMEAFPRAFERCDATMMLLQQYESS